MESALEELKQLAGKGEPGRRQLMLDLQKLAYSLETVNDTLQRYGHLHLQTAAVKIGIDLGIFRALAESGRSLTVKEISQKSGADVVLANRVLRYLAAVAAVDEIGESQYAANHVTKNLTERVTEAATNHYFGTVSPVYQALPEFLKRTGYQDPSDEQHAAFQDAWNTTLHVYAWFAGHPDHLGPFNNYMALRRHTDLSWLTVYPVTQETKDWDPRDAVLVNIGGGVGHQCAQFKERYPQINGRVILQDLPHSIAKALPTPGVENMAHDFFEPQPIRGAKFYHLRGVLHNHSPHKVRQLLGNIKSAMSSSSILLIDEMVLPEAGVSFEAASIDMAMLSAFASMERTEAQWRDILHDVGLELVDKYVYNPESYETVLDVRLPSSL